MNNDGLVLCKTPQDYIDMYKGPVVSCMDFSNMAGIRGEMYNKYGYWPSMWYAYVKDLTGFYYRYNNEPIARGFINTTENKAYPYLYFADKILGPKETRVRVVESLNNIGITKCCFKEYKITKAIKVPSIVHKGYLWCPIPYVDFVQKPLVITFEDGAFTFKPRREASLDTFNISDCYRGLGWLRYRLEDNDFEYSHDL